MLKQKTSASMQHRNLQMFATDKLVIMEQVFKFKTLHKYQNWKN